MGTRAFFPMESGFSTNKRRFFEIPHGSTTCRTWILHPMQIYTQSNRPLFGCSCVQWEVPSSKYVLMLLFGASKYKALQKYPYFNFDVGVSPCGKLTPCPWNVQKPALQCIFIVYLSIYTSMYAAKCSINNQVHVCIRKCSLILLWRSVTCGTSWPHRF